MKKLNKIGTVVFFITLGTISLTLLPAPRPAFTRDSQDVYGYVEKIIINPGELELKAKLDTGANTSSLNAQDLTVYRQKGKDRVRFYVLRPFTGNQVGGKREKVYFEKDVSRYVHIKQHEGESHKRPVVYMDVIIGRKKLKSEFSLADRSKYLYQVLIGRNILDDIGLVDVTRTFVSDPRLPE
jgi:hypothetical protein